MHVTQFLDVNIGHDLNIKPKLNGLFYLIVCRYATKIDST